MSQVSLLGMKAIMKIKPEPGIEVVDVPVPEVKADEVLIRVKAASICGSDLGIYKYTSAYSKMTLPVIMGHEFSGDIVEKGKEVSNYEIGDRVLSESVKACSVCRFCREGSSNLCEKSKLFGIHAPGGFAEYISVPYKLLHRIPDEMSYEDAALVEPLSNALHFVKDITPFRINDFIVVQGCGPIGLYSAQLFKLGGAEVVMTGLSVDTKRFELAHKLGIETINIQEQNLEEIVKERTNNAGADIAYVAVGAPPAVKQAAQIVKKRGRITVVGIFGSKVPIDMTWLVRRELEIKGAYDAKPENFPQSIELISKELIDVNTVLTHRYKLEEAKKAFQTALNMTAGKIQFKP